MSVPNMSGRKPLYFERSSTRKAAIVFAPVRHCFNGTFRGISAATSRTTPVSAQAIACA